MTKLFSDLFANAQTDAASLKVTGITADSRRVRPGYVFIAVPGVKVDGMQYAQQAVEAGAVAVVGEQAEVAGLSVPYHRVRDVRQALSVAASRMYPAQPETIVAVTGTSGKSSVADFSRQLFSAAGKSAASLGTLGVITDDGAAYGSLTTPDPISLHETLNRLATNGIECLAMEASSHGIEQRRLESVRLKGAAFTNLGRDHLDYHGTIEAYAEAKLRLFEELLDDDAFAVVNADGAYSDIFLPRIQKRGLRVTTTGLKGKDIRLLSAEVQNFHQMLVVEAYGERFEIEFPLLGDFQVENALVAAACVINSEGKQVTGRVMKALNGLMGVCGRLEKVGEINGAMCIVDYSHKPDALSHVLDAVRPFVTGRLFCVFGCGGDRDRGKRPIMGQIASEKADVVIVTDDNPRSEEPGAIRAEIMAEAKGAREIGDRSLAIHTAVSELQSGDILIVAGKGHETGQIVGEKTLPFSDHAEIRSAIVGCSK
ncbi:UDP-N-acetylmuramoyl-L-alanyl-D-glutamate--2,6-diaminopimelate ligase [Microvirga sp. W0021]|uniref:UDP-N-acetylmuramoyl-L-alanyl-D-glutamate--2,6-diaminopimelate ligase n=1 Tax=Hohaiivirga grylli TaxID=3133970 RepID=A0ABV0BKT8_9HYPH